MFASFGLCRFFCPCFSFYAFVKFLIRTRTQKSRCTTINKETLFLFIWKLSSHEWTHLMFCHCLSSTHRSQVHYSSCVNIYGEIIKNPSILMHSSEYCQFYPVIQWIIANEKPNKLYHIDPFNLSTLSIIL